MNHIIRTVTAVTALGLATGVMATGVAAGADLLQAPAGAEAGDPGAWTPVVARSYEQHYTDVQCLALSAPDPAATTTYDLGTAPSGQWFFAVVASEAGLRQYGPAEFAGSQVLAEPGAAGLIGCHGIPLPGGGAAPEVPAEDTMDTGPTPAAAVTDALAPPAASPVAMPVSPAPSPSASSPVPDAVASGLEGGRSGLVVLGVGAVLVAGLALLGRRARA